LSGRKIVVTGATFPDVVADRLLAGGFEIETVAADLNEEGVIKALQGAWGYVLGGSERMSKHSWDSLPDLAVVSFLGTGYESFIELPVTPSRTQFTYTPHANAVAVAEFAIGQMLDCVRGLTRRIVGVQNGVWNEDATPSLIGARLGIAGMGHIGKEVARMANAAFGMDVYYWNRTRRPALDKLPYESVPTLLDLCEAVDVVVVAFAHEPGQNDGAIGAAELVALGADGFLVNATRAELVDPVALREALENGSIAGASMDGYYIEPTPGPDEDPHGLLRLVPEKLLVTPHCAYLSNQAIRRMADMATENILSVARDEVPPYLIER